MKRPAATPKSRSVLKRPGAKIEDAEEIEEEAPPRKRPSANLEQEIQTEDAKLPVLVEKPEKEKTHARSANVLWEKRYPSGWILSEVETKSGRKYKKYTAPSGHDFFSKVTAESVGFEGK